MARRYRPGIQNGALMALTFLFPIVKLRSPRHWKAGPACNCRVNTQRNARLLAPLGAHEQRKPARVFEGGVFTGRLRLANGGIGQGLEYISRLVGSRRCISMPDRDAPLKNRFACHPDSLYLKMYLKNVAGGGFRWIALERKKTPKRLFSMAYRLPRNSVDR